MWGINFIMLVSETVKVLYVSHIVGQKKKYVQK